MDAYRASNRRLWNSWTNLHVSHDSSFYDLEHFRQGETSLNFIELEEVDEVAGQSLLHLQCHFGMDTLSWARRGATVTGADFSDEAIRQAEALRDEVGLPARFVCADLYALPDVLDDAFDIVFTSYGVLPWLPDIGRWAEIVHHFLKPGGMFYLVENHPMADTLDDTGTALAYDYFPAPEPERFDEPGSYAVPDVDVEGASYQWAHPLGAVVTALLDAGLRLDFLHEFAVSPYCYPDYLVETAPGRYTWPEGRPTLPLLYSIKAHRPA